MISIKWFRENFELLQKRLNGRDLSGVELQQIKDLDIHILKLKTEIDSARREKNLLSKNFDSIQIQRVNEIKNKLKSWEEDYIVCREKFDKLISLVPAIPDEDIPFEDREDYVWGEIKKDIKFKSYLELLSDHKLVEFKSSVNISGSGFSTYTGKGEKIFRALIDFTLDWAEKHGFQRYYLPVIVNKDSLFCTSQISKFKNTLFQIWDREKFLSPTAEVQLVNIYRNQIIAENKLPLKLCANTNCFRNEKIGAGVASKGIMRLYQFNKTELVMIVSEKDSEWAFNYLSGVIEGILKELELPFRRILLSRRELSFSSSRTYDFEVWIPSEGKYREISSLSNTRDFQSIRGSIRYKKNVLDSKEKSRNVHILNGSCLAIDRLFAAIIENYQLSNGSIKVPTCLTKYLNLDLITN